MGDVVMTRWRRWGKDRLYVETTDGVKVGFWDLADDTGHPESPELEATLSDAVLRWRDRARADRGSTNDVDLNETSSAPVGVDTPGSHAERTACAEAVAGPTQADETSSTTPHAALIATDLEQGADLVPPTIAAEGAAPVRPWVDLATNVAGAEAREQANARRDAAPVKTVFARILGVHTDERAWRIGADGEQKVATQLEKIQKKDPRWRVLHSVPVGGRGSDIDHVVIGPGGVFTANAKHHPDAAIWVGGNTFMVNGSKQPYIRDARHEAQRASRLLTEACGFPVHVEGLVVTVNAKTVTVKSQPQGVSVIPRMQVARWLLRHGDIHPDEVIDAIFEVARRSTTWR